FYRCELFQVAGYRQRENCIVSGFALLGWCARRASAWLVDVDEDQVGQIAWHLRSDRFDSDRRLHDVERAGSDLEHGVVRILQLDHVPEYLCSWDRRAWADDQQGIGTD